MISFSVEHNCFSTENNNGRNQNEEPISFQFLLLFENITILTTRGGGGVGGGQGYHFHGKMLDKY